MSKKKKRCCGNCGYSARINKEESKNYNTDVHCTICGASFNFGVLGCEYYGKR